MSFFVLVVVIRTRNEDILVLGSRCGVVSASLCARLRAEASLRAIVVCFPCSRLRFAFELRAVSFGGYKLAECAVRLLSPQKYKMHLALQMFSSEGSRLGCVRGGARVHMRTRVLARARARLRVQVRAWVRVWGACACV